MQSRKLEAIIVAVVAAGVTCAAQAGVVQSASAVSGPPTFPGTGFVWERTIDQSGLFGGYVSGVTDFDAYVAAQPRHIGSNSPPNYAASPEPLGEVDYDLGATLEILKLAFWNYPFADSAGPTRFQVFTSNSSSFAAATLVGTFEPVNDGLGLGGLGNLVQVFDLVDTSARYLRIDVLGVVAASGIGWSEVAFDVSALAIPEPQTYALLLAGLTLLGFAARIRIRGQGRN